jgi:hypothetical protein
MRVARGKVVGQTVVLEDDTIPDGSSVTVWTDDVAGFELDEQSQELLMESDADCERGEGITAEDLFKRLAVARGS